MGRPRSPEDRLRTSWFEVRCTPAYKEALGAVVKKGEYRDLSAMVEGAIERERQRLELPPLPPR